jgi:tetratricopeptide (TPR) repeat protein
MNSPQIQQLLNALQAEDEATREQATQQLWQLWFNQKGLQGLNKLIRTQELLEAGEVGQAETLLNDLIADQPDFAEAWNRRAVLHYSQGNYPQAIADCEQVVSLVPFHFGAWHGLGLCYAAQGEFRSAIQAFRQALEFQPHALINQRLILECTARLTD